jgi:short-subunit dehydrogenase
MLECAKADSSYCGHVVNTASMAGLLNAPNLGVYNVSKHAVVALSETLYHDLQLVDAPIGASVLCPFFVPTGIDQSQRNRPATLRNAMPQTPSQLASQAMLEKAVSAGKVSAAQVAQLTFDAIRDDRFYIYSHPGALRDVQTRMDDILQQRNPSDPYAAAPHIGEMLKTQLKTSCIMNPD